MNIGNESNFRGRVLLGLAVPARGINNGLFGPDISGLECGGVGVRSSVAVRSVLDGSGVAGISV